MLGQLEGGEGRKLVVGGRGGREGGRSVEEGGEVPPEPEPVVLVRMSCSGGGGGGRRAPLAGVRLGGGERVGGAGQARGPVGRLGRDLSLQVFWFGFSINVQKKKENQIMFLYAMDKESTSFLQPDRILYLEFPQSGLVILLLRI